MKQLLCITMLALMSFSAKSQSINIINSTSCAYFANVNAKDGTCSTNYYAPGISIPPAHGGVPSVTNITLASAPWCCGSSPSVPFVWIDCMINDYTCGAPLITFGNCGTTASGSPGTYTFCGGACQSSITYTWSIDAQGNVNISF